MFTRLFRLTLLGSLDRWIVDPDASRHIASLWRIREDDLPGPGQWRSKCCRRSAMTAAFAGVFGSNVAVSAPDARRIQQRLRKLDLLVVSDFLLSETAALADVVRRSDEATSFRRAILATSSTSCGSRATGVQPTTRASRTNGFAATDGLFWPCPDLTHPGTPRLFIERFPTPSGRARFHAVHHDAPAEAADEHYPLYLTTGRLLAQYQSGTQTTDRRTAGTGAHGVRRGPPGNCRTARTLERRGDCADHPARHHAAAGPGHTVDPRGHGVRAVSLGRRAVDPPAHQPGARSNQPHAGVQGLRGRGANCGHGATRSRSTADRGAGPRLRLQRRDARTNRRSGPGRRTQPAIGAMPPGPAPAAARAGRRCRR
jgi:hypothetical protein